MAKRAMFGVLLALAAAVPGSFSCLEAERDCSLDTHCCQGMTCKKDGGSVYGKCRSGASASGSISDFYSVGFHQHEGFRGSVLYTWGGQGSGIFGIDYGTCQGLIRKNPAGHSSMNLGDSLDDQVSSIGWTDNVVLVVYDGYNCGGNSLVIYSSGPHKMVKSNGMTENYGFLANKETDLATVCKKDRCGYTSTSSSVSYNVDGSVGLNLGKIVTVNAGVGGGETWEKAVAWDRCECTETWDDSIRSFRVFRRVVGTDREVRRRRREIPRKNISPAER